MRGLSGCLLDIYEPDVVDLKAKLKQAGYSQPQIEALPAKWFAKRLYVTWTIADHMLITEK